jgi:hypothetical protein
MFNFIMLLILRGNPFLKSGVWFHFARHAMQQKSGGI